MCGRYVSVASDEDLSDEFDVLDVLGPAPAPSWNVAPTDDVRIVTRRRPHDADDDAPSATQLRTVRWGLVPTWSKDPRGGARMINARIETVTSKPAFKRAAAVRRCLVPALGYYEWQRDGGARIPYFLHDPAGGLLAMAGLYELWRDRTKDDEDPARWLWSCTVITQDATDTLGEIHDRSPVLVPPDLRAAWLDCSDGEASTAQGLLDRFEPARLEPYRVGKAVGNVANNGPHLIEPAGEPVEPEQQVLDL